MNCYFGLGILNQACMNNTVILIYFYNFSTFTALILNGHSAKNISKNDMTFIKIYNIWQWNLTIRRKNFTLGGIDANRGIMRKRITDIELKN